MKKPGKLATGTAFGISGGAQHLQSRQAWPQIVLNAWMMLLALFLIMSASR
jgi:hypothetical protein